ncbi:MAG: hypothetical protein HW389_3443 [Bacteroidetes bacterium]|nr:hypothetical protein [Bacteroidota bacterium]
MVHSPTLHKRNAESAPRWGPLRPRDGTAALSGLRARDPSGGGLLLGNLPTRTTAVVCRIVRSGGPKIWKDSRRTFGRFEGCERWRGCTPPIRYKRAREPIARLVVRNTSNLHTGNLPKVDVCTKRTFGRCNTGRCRATRSCVSDAVHEFSRARSPGRYPMLSFRDPRGPQLLLMRPSSLCKGVVGQPHNDEAFS